MIALSSNAGGGCLHFVLVKGACPVQKLVGCYDLYAVFSCLGSLEDASIIAVY